MIDGVDTEWTSKLRLDSFEAGCCADCCQASACCNCMLLQGSLLHVAAMRGHQAAAKVAMKSCKKLDASMLAESELSAVALWVLGCSVAGYGSDVDPSAGRRRCSWVAKCT